MELNNASEYNQAENDFILWLTSNEGSEKAEKAARAEALVKIGKLKQLAVKGKLEQVLHWIEDFIASDEKLVVFTTHKSTIDSIMAKFPDISIKLDGSTPLKQRPEVVETFQTNDKIRLFVGNIRAAGIGITLTAASNVAFVELGFSPSEHDQAEDRVHRIGQESDSVTAYYLLAQNTIEQSIAELIDKKRKVLDQVLDGKITENSNLLTELIKTYTNK